MAKSKKITKKELSTLEKVIERLGSSFTYEFEFDYTCINHPDEYDKLTDVRIRNDNKKSFIRCLDPALLKVDTITDYCTLRMVSGLDINDSFDCYARHGYYGDEPEATVKHEILDKFRTMIGMSENEAIEFSLIEEYGYLLPFLKGANWKLEKETPCDRIHMPVDNLYVRLNRKKIEEYKLLYEKDPYNKLSLIPNCMCFSGIGDRLSLIDGRHRYIAAKEMNLNMTVVVGSKT